MTSIDRSPAASERTQRVAPGKTLREATMPSLAGRVARAWTSGSGCIPAGLVGSFLTCLASVSINLLIDSGARGIPADLYLRKLVAGYAAAAFVVVALFPLMTTLARRFLAPSSEPPA